MTQNYGFPFADSNGDRQYTDVDFAAFYAKLFSNGVFTSYGQAFKVGLSATGGMRVNIGTGAVFINGRMWPLDTATDLVIQPASALQNRTDSIVARLDLANRWINIFYKQSDTSVTRNATVYELQLAIVLVPQNSTVISISNINDMRSNSLVCGYVTPFQTLPVDGMVQQYGDLINTWFQGMKDQLSTDAAINLQNQINTLLTTATTFTGDKTFTGNVTAGSLSVTGPMEINIPNWVAGNTYRVGDVVRVGSLGALSSGLLTNALFRCVSAHTAGTTFPASGNSYWVLLNQDAYTIVATNHIYFNLVATWRRQGDQTTLYLEGTISGTISQNSNFANISETIPANTFYPAQYFPGTTNTQYQVTKFVIDGHPDYTMAFKLTPNSNVIQAATWFNGNTVGSGTTGNAMPLQYVADPATRAWVAGTPTG